MQDKVRKALPRRPALLRRAGAAQVLGANFAAGSLGGALAAAVTTPLDVVKTRTQLGDGARHMVRRVPMSMLLTVTCHVSSLCAAGGAYWGRGPAWRHAARCVSLSGPGILLCAGKSADPACAHPDVIAPRACAQPVLGTLREVAAEGGVRALFVGVGPRAVRAAPACAIVLAAYEVIKAARSGGGALDTA
jgi:solute carrier family 25 protein 39/40